ncbi:MAG TPA: DUF4440 domain-containing protein [Gammaproteobacteria bacterium]
MNTLRRIPALLILACLVSLAGCAAQPMQDSRSMQAAQESIQDTHNAFLKAFNAKDAAGVAAVYTDDAIIMPPNYPAVKTSIAIQTFMREQLVPPMTGMLLNVAETQVTGDYAFSSGYYTLLGENGATLDHGKFLQVLKQQGRDWKVYREAYNSDQAAAQPDATMAPAAATH